MSHLSMGFNPAYGRPGQYGDQLTEAQRVLARAQQIMERVQVMQQQATRALWCEPGDHPFSAKDPDMKVMTISDADGAEESVTMCGEHVPKIGRRQKAIVQDTPPAAEGEQVKSWGLYAHG